MARTARIVPNLTHGRRGAHLKNSTRGLKEEVSGAALRGPRGGPKTEHLPVNKWLSKNLNHKLCIYGSGLSKVFVAYIVAVVTCSVNARERVKYSILPVA